jgi:hypothetical protein
MDKDLLELYGLKCEYYTREELAAVIEVFSKALGHFTKKGDLIEVEAGGRIFAIVDHGEEFKLYSVEKKEPVEEPVQLQIPQ